MKRLRNFRSINHHHNVNFSRPAALASPQVLSFILLLAKLHEIFEEGCSFEDRISLLVSNKDMVFRQAPLKI